MQAANNFRGEFKVDFKGKTLNALFTMNAVRLIIGGEKIKLSEFDKWLGDDPLTAIPTIAYYSVVNWHVQNGKKFGASKEQFIALVLDGGQLEAITEVIGTALNPDEGEEPGK